MKQTQAIVTISVAGTLVAFTVAYGIAFGLKMPLPLINDGVYKPDYATQNAIMNQWDNVQLRSEGTAVESTESKTTDVEGANLDNFNEIDKATVDSYMESNDISDISSLYVDSLAITGMKTVNNEDIIALDVGNQVALVDTIIDSAKAKVAILRNNKKVSLSVVDDLTYWSNLEEHSTKNNSIVAINANDYTWNSTGNYGKVYGLVKSNGNDIRRSQNKDNVYGFDSEGKMTIGSEDVTQGSEANTIVTKDGQIQSGLDTTKVARTLIGQAEDGTVFMVVVDGNEGGQGATLQSIAEYMEKYKVVNLVCLSSGKCSVMTWKDKVVNTPFGEPTGIKLPTAWVYR